MLYLAVKEDNPDSLEDKLFESLARSHAGERLIHQVEAEESGLVFESLCNMGPAVGIPFLEPLSVHLTVSPEIIKRPLAVFAPEISGSPNALDGLDFILIGYCSPCRRAVAVALGRIKILMHIEIGVYSVFLAKLKYTIDLIKVFIIIITRGRLKLRPCEPEPDKVEALVAEFRQQLIIDGVSILLLTGLIIALINDVNAVEYPLSAELVDKSCGFGSYSVHFGLLF